MKARSLSDIQENIYRNVLTSNLRLDLDADMSWRDGRRIVDLAELAKNLYCKQCRAVLDLNHTEKEARVGLASVLYVVCHCGVTNDVHTGAKQHDARDGRTTYFINMVASASK